MNKNHGMSTCWVDNRSCPDSQRMVLGVLGSGLCKDCSRTNGYKLEIENFFFELFGMEKEEWINKESLLSDLIQEDIVENSFFVYDLLETLTPFLVKELMKFVSKIDKAESIFQIKAIISENKDLISVSGGSDAFEEILRILDSEDSDIKKLQAFSCRLSELFDGSHFENSSIFAEIISIFRNVDQTQCT